MGRISRLLREAHDKIFIGGLERKPIAPTERRPLSPMPNRGHLGSATRQQWWAPKTLIALSGIQILDNFLLRSPEALAIK